jgi:tetratricopeptide (TPR) repeat protein
MLSACKHMAVGLAVGALLGTAAPARPMAGGIGPGTAGAQRGTYLAAELLLKRAIAIDKRVHGPNYPGLATSLSKLATLYQTAGRHAAAELLLKRAIAIDKKALGPEHPDLAGRLNNLAVLYWATNRPAAAESLFARAIAILEKSLLPDHPALAAVRENYANLLVQLGHGSWTRLEPRLSAE